MVAVIGKGGWMDRCPRGPGKEGEARVSAAMAR